MRSGGWPERSSTPIVATAFRGLDEDDLTLADEELLEVSGWSEAGTRRSGAVS